MTAGIIRLISGAQARWAGVEPVAADGSIPQRIYFANHSSHLNAPVIWASLPIELRRVARPVAARDYWERSAARRYLASKVFRAVLIDRKKVTAHAHPLAPLEEALAAGDSLILFPEGTRTDDEEGEMNHFKPGLWHLAKKHPGVQFVPVYLEDLNRILPKGEFLFVPLLSAVTFGTPIRIEESEDKTAFLERARLSVEALARDPEEKA